MGNRNKGGMEANSLFKHLSTYYVEGLLWGKRNEEILASKKPRKGRTVNYVKCQREDKSDKN